MVTTVIKTIGTGGDFPNATTGPQDWFNASPLDYTLNVTATTGAGSTTSTIQLDAAASATAGAYVGNTLTIGAETLLITAYNATTKVATVGSLNGGPAAFSTAPASGVSYTIGPVIWQGKLLNQVWSGTSTILTMSGKTASATCYPDLRTAAGASVFDNAANPARVDKTKGATFETTVDSCHCIYNQMQYARFDGIQLLCSSTGANAAAVLRADNNNCDYNRIIAEGACSNTAITGVISTGGTSVFRNSAVIQKSTNAASYIAAITGGMKVANVTMVSLNTTLSAGVFTSYAQSTFRNVYIGNCTAAIFDNSGSAGYPSFVYSSATSAASWPTLGSGSTGNLVNVAMSTANFMSVTPGTHDLRLAAGSALIDVGTTDASTATGPYGTARPQGAAFDIGAFEYVAAAAPPADTTAPTLVSPTAAANGANAYTGSVSTDEAGGSLYYYILPAATAAPDAPAMVASASTRAVSSTGTQPVSGSGLTQNTPYRLHFMQKDTAGNASTVVSSASFTTAALDTTAPAFPNGAVITPGTITSSSVVFSYPAATDTAPGVVAGYEISKNGGGGWTDNGTGLSGQFTGLTASTAYTIQVRAYDNANPKNYSAALSLSMTTSASATGTFTTDACTSSGTLRANQTYVGTWFAGGVIGTAVGTPTQISGTLSAGATATVTANKGAGYVMLKFTDGGVMYQEGTVA